MRWYSHVAFIGAPFILAVLVIFLCQNVSRNYQISMNAQCTGHLASNIHYHSQLTIIFKGKQYPIPENIGIHGNCIHPVHTHDETGLIHVDYPKYHPFTLRDFFDAWGIRFNDKQLGSFHSYDGYNFTTTVDGQIIKNPEKYVIEDGKKINIIITKD